MKKIVLFISLYLGAQAAASETASSKIDTLLDTSYQAAELKPYALVDDATFLRRAYLDIAGRIPTYPETTRFLDAKDANKRHALVDTLLDSKGYTHHMFNWWADLLRVKSRLPNQVPGTDVYIAWIKQQIAENTPYDEVVRALITAEGFPRDDPAVGYYLRDNGMPLDNMSNTAQVFLGTRLQCAQCHDHPFDQWTQKDFYEMAAYTYGVKTRRGPQETPELREVFQHVRQERFQEFRKARMQGKRPDPASMRPDPTMRRAFQELFTPFFFGALENKRPLRLPDDYQYDNAQPRQVIHPSTPFGAEARISDAVNPREVYAGWMTDPGNERFTKVIANRMWKKAFGRGLFEPLDDLNDKTQVSHPALLDFLEQEMVRLDYDLKAFLGVLYKTDLYQREKHARDIGSSETYAFQGPVMQRMSAEQLWDSLMTLATRNLDDKQGQPAPQRYGNQEKRAALVESKTAEEVLTMARELAGLEKEYAERFVAMRAKAQEMEGADRRDRMRYGREAGKLQRERAAKVAEILGEEPAMSMRMMSDRRPGNIDRFLLRAAELPSPMNPGHFLRQFGQSDREVIENANQEASIPQVLALLNGDFSRTVLNPKSPLRDLAVEGRGLQTGERIFTAIMSRPPDAGEKQLIEQQLRKHGKTGIANVGWALVNTQQFLFIP